MKLSVAITLLFLFVLGQGRAQSLESYLEEADANSPMVKGYDLEHQAASEKMNEANSLPNTELGAGYFVSEPETRTGPQRFKLSVKQMLPWFGTFGAQREYLGALADERYVDWQVARRKLALSVSHSYYALYAQKAQLRILKENIQLLQTYEQWALAAVGADRATAVDVLRLQMRENKLLEQQQVLEAKQKAEALKFGKLLGREEPMPIVVADTLLLPDKDVVVDDGMLHLNPELLKYDKMYRSVEEAENLNQKDAAPKMGVGLDYIAVSERPDLQMADNGKDILMPMLSVSLPLFEKTHRSRTAQHQLKEAAIQAQKDDRLKTLEAVLAETLSKRTAARIQVETQYKNLEQARAAEKILTKGYETATLDFTQLLEVQELQLQFQMGIIAATQQYYEQAATLNYLIDPSQN